MYVAYVKYEKQVKQMKEMKKVLLSIISTALYVVSVNSTTYMFVKKSDNQVDKYDLEEVKQVVYEEESLTSTEGRIGDYEYIDLGLPSKIKWATCNVGATSPSENGDYFAWGETQTKSSFKMSNSDWVSSSPERLLDYCVISEENDTTDTYSLGNLTSKYDVATVNWGDAWRTPSLEDIVELIKNCKWVWEKNTEDNGVSGFKVIGPNGMTIFFPAAGTDNSSYYVGWYGHYWSSTASSYVNNGDNAYNYSYFLSFSNAEYIMWKYDLRYTGGSIRPVSDSNTFMVIELADGKLFKYNLREIKNVSYGETEGEADGKIGDYDYVDLGLPSGIKWATCNVGANTPEEYGNYFAWGETTPKDTYTADNSKWNDFSAEDLLTSGVIDSVKDTTQKYAIGRLTAEYDAATANWGNTWRMPTLDEVYELKRKCTWEWTTKLDAKGNNVNGYEVTGPNGNSIFIPASGSSHIRPGDYSYYLTSSAYNYDNKAFKLNISIDRYYFGYYSRYDGNTVRPVSE